MDELTRFSPPDVADEGHIIRRLGWAFLRQWSVMPGDIRERVRRQALLVEDRHDAEKLDEKIQAFIARHAKGP